MLQYILALKFIFVQMSEKIQQVLHVKSEDLRLYSLADENSPILLEDEAKTIGEQDFYVQKQGAKDGFVLLVESKCVKVTCRVR